MLTDSWLKSQHRKSHKKPFEKADRDGMGVRVSVKGKLTWQIRYEFAGKARRLSIGTYPAVKLKDARTEAERLMGVLQSGTDPAMALQLAKLRRSSGTTLKELFMQWYEKDCKLKKTKPEQILRSFEIHIFPKLGDWELEMIKVQVWVNQLEVVTEKAPAVAGRILSNAKLMYRWLIRRGWVEYNPLSDISPWHDLGIQKQSRTRSLNDDELKLVLQAVNGSRMAEKNRLFFKLCLLYGCRPIELIRAERGHFDTDGNVWTVPASNHKLGAKTGKPLLRPITPMAGELIHAAGELSESPVWLFTKAGDPESQLTHSMTLASPINLSKWIYKNRGVMLDHWSFYDLRKTARTNWSTLTQPHIAEIMLGHKLPGDWQVYDQHDYLGEQAECLKLWGDRLISLGVME